MKRQTGDTAVSDKWPSEESKLNFFLKTGKKGGKNEILCHINSTVSTNLYKLNNLKIKNIYKKNNFKYLLTS